MKRITIVLLALASITWAGERVKNVYHAHKLTERIVVVSCDEGSAQVSTSLSKELNTIVVECK